MSELRLLSHSNSITSNSQVYCVIVKDTSAFEAYAKGLRVSYGQSLDVEANIISEPFALN